MKLTDILAELTSLPGVSGSEDAAAQWAMEFLKPCMDEVYRDAMGNVLAYRKAAKPGAKKLLLDAHIDEIGFVITGSEGGFLSFDAVGGLNPGVLPGAEVMLLTEPPAYGFIACLPPHILSAEQREKPFAIKDLYIDVGLADASSIKPGTFGLLTGELTQMGEYASGKALDNRACTAVVLDAVAKLMDVPLDVELHVMLSAQEELGTRGAAPGAFTAAPDYCVVVDVTYGRSKSASKNGTFELGCGVTVGVGSNMNRKFSSRLFDICERYEIPHEIEVLAMHSGTNAAAIQISREGVATALLSVPIRYMHSPAELMKVSDAEYASDVLVNLIRDWGNYDD